MKYSQLYNSISTPQSEQADPRQVPNSAGGYSFQVDDWKQLERFLILGTEGGSYYASEKKLTFENCKVVERCLDKDGIRAVAMIAAVSEQGRAPKNDAAVFALALAACHKDSATRLTALTALPKVCRIGTHLFQFVEAVNANRGWGRQLKTAISNWYTSKSEADLCYQLCKYQQRGGMSHRDVFRLTHPQGLSQPVARWVIGADAGARRISNKDRGQTREYPAAGPLPMYLQASNELKTASERRTIELIHEFHFTHEMIRTELKNSRDVWEALLENMPMTALVRNLAKMTEVGLLKPLSTGVATVRDQLGSVERIHKSRLHPIALLAALKVYEQGHGEKSSLTWKPVPSIIDALDGAFYSAFDNVVPSGKRTLLALDVSGSMDWGDIAGIPGVTPRVAAGALAMVTARTEANWHVLGFSDRLVDIPISPRMRLDDVLKTIARIPMGATDCALPMQHALGEKLDVDVFHVYTDSETYFGNLHPHEALRQYRTRRSIPDAKLAIVAMVANAISLADPTDPNMLDVVGFSTDTPAVLAQFAKGW